MPISPVVVGTKITADHQNDIIDQVNQNTEDIEGLQAGGGVAINDATIAVTTTWSSTKIRSETGDPATDFVSVFEDGLV